MSNYQLSLYLFLDSPDKARINAPMNVPAIGVGIPAAIPPNTPFTSAIAQLSFARLIWMVVIPNRVMPNDKRHIIGMLKPKVADSTPKNTQSIAMIKIPL
jgi:hypothetical protein